MIRAAKPRTKAQSTLIGLAPDLPLRGENRTRYRTGGMPGGLQQQPCWI
jgi:hypothetical protein